MAGLRAGLLFAIKLINPKIDRVKKREVDVFGNGSNQTGMVLFRISADAL